MNSLAHLALLGWVPFAMLAFVLLSPRRASLAVMATGWLFLPQLEIPVPGFINYGKPAAISYSMLLGVLLFDRARLLRFRPKLLDLVFLVWLVASFMASMSHELGLKDASSAFVDRFVVWGVPYVIGAMYLRSSAGLRDFLWTMFLSGLVYVPFALFEVRMSPQLHRIVYGMSQHGFEQTMRGGGWRPMVFMRHGLELSLWMAMATVAGFALWKFLRVRRFQGLPMSLLIVGLAGTVVLCKSSGATVLFGLAMLLIWPKWALWPRRLLVLMIPIYIALRLWGEGEFEKDLIEWARLISDDRAGSLQFRFDNERLLIDHYWNYPWFGGGGWDFGAIADAESDEMQIVTTDSMWILAFAKNGLVGLFGFLFGLWLPVARGMGLAPFIDSRRAPMMLASGLILAMVLVDTMVNAFLPPVYLALAGGLAHFALVHRPPPIRSHILRPRWRGEPARWPFA